MKTNKLVSAVNRMQLLTKALILFTKREEQASRALMSIDEDAYQEDKEQVRALRVQRDQLVQLREGLGDLGGNLDVQIQDLDAHILKLTHISSPTNITHEKVAEGVKKVEAATSLNTVAIDVIRVCNDIIASLKYVTPLTISILQRLHIPRKIINELPLVELRETYHKRIDFAFDQLPIEVQKELTTEYKRMLIDALRSINRGINEYHRAKEITIEDFIAHERA